MSIIVDVEDITLETRNKKGGGEYQVQEGFAHTTDRNGKPQRYPEKITLFPPRDPQGNPVPYKPGQYEIAPQSFRVERGFLELGFLQLTSYKTRGK